MSGFINWWWPTTAAADAMTREKRVRDNIRDNVYYRADATRPEQFLLAGGMINGRRGLLSTIDNCKYILFLGYYNCKYILRPLICRAYEELQTIALASNSSFQRHRFEHDRTPNIQTSEQTHNKFDTV